MSKIEPVFIHYFGRVSDIVPSDEVQIEVHCAIQNPVSRKLRPISNELDRVISALTEVMRHA